MNKKELGMRIKELREQANLKQNQIAGYLGIDQSYLSKIETGERAASLEQLSRLAELYGCDLSIFEDNTVEVKPINIKFRSKSIEVEDLKAIASINHIAINSRFMAEILGGI